MFYSRVGNGWLRSTCILHVLLPLSGLAFKSAPPCDDDDDAGDDDDDHAIVLLHHRPIVVDTFQRNINQYFEPGWLCQLYQCTVEQMMFLDVFIFMPRHSGGKGGGENMQKI